MKTKTSDINYKDMPIGELKEHPKNYRKHPEDQIQHIVDSIEQNGIYRNVVIASDNVILAGHGVVQACKIMELKTVPVIQLNIKSDSVEANKILIGDNEISKLGEIDDRVLTNILKEIKESELGLSGTGFDEMMLANLIYVTRSASEIADINEAAEWVGMPEFGTEKTIKLMVGFDSKEDRDDFSKLIGIQLTDKTRAVRWPYRDREDPSNVKFEEDTNEVTD